ncbi:uncharacterized protein LACBIDRAFT_325118 [Laccaria bicolor S238N-H82]|uniref:Predicted protein n=1 Tax=Laccaria bicolor (strain S238N-H82 / ATCC MYA-4686) TaxID=486041 RepID=B0D577_LACBS|nr:uncharacterized protein LACBIDRAFT_325118 [Laccaria bicolor S238N-H82]EDR10469.1 predicted protein [Laccaria bicolor S238N-H82]|eukprot:XP_001878919.1 predicted protein [Laccaria bicolor S238N-H82]
MFAGLYLWYVCAGESQISYLLFKKPRCSMIGRPKGSQAMDTLHPKSHRGVGKRCSFNMKSTLDVVWNQDTFPSPVLDLLGIGLEYTFRPFDRCLYCLLLGKSRRKRTESLDMARILEASFVQGANQIKNSVPRLIDSNPQRNEKKVGGEVDSLHDADACSISLG